MQMSSPKLFMLFRLFYAQQNSVCNKKSDLVDKGWESRKSADQQLKTCVWGGYACMLPIWQPSLINVMCCISYKFHSLAPNSMNDLLHASSRELGPNAPWSSTFVLFQWLLGKYTKTCLWLPLQPLLLADPLLQTDILFVPPWDNQSGGGRVLTCEFPCQLLARKLNYVDNWSESEQGLCVCAHTYIPFQAM